MSEWVDIGSSVFVETYTCPHRGSTPSGALVRFGGTLDDEGYDRDDVCVGGVSWCPECKGPTWELLSLDPLHIEPSIRTTCHNHSEHHGYIRNGRWVNSDGPTNLNGQEVNEVSELAVSVTRDLPDVTMIVAPGANVKVSGNDVMSTEGDEIVVDGPTAVALQAAGHANPKVEG